MMLATENYLAQKQRWPESGRHILAQFDDHAVVVYQAYRPSIGHFAAQLGRFGGEFSFSRMSWIKPNFLWMMFRSSWGTAAGQEVVLAVTLKREAFDEILAQAVPSKFVPELHASRKAWEEAVSSSQVRLQWDPDHSPRGGKLERRALQIGLRGEVLARYASDWIVRIEDISPFVAEQRAVLASGDLSRLVTPAERVYPVDDEAVARRLRLSRVNDPEASDR